MESNLVGMVLPDRIFRRCLLLSKADTKPHHILSMEQYGITDEQPAQVPVILTLKLK